VQREGLSPKATDVYKKANHDFQLAIEEIKNRKSPNIDQNKLVQNQLRSITAEMETGLIERGTEVRLLLLAAISGEHILLVGPPGTAKSKLGRRLSRVCKGTYFERLLTKFSVPEELFGPLSMRALEEDQYVRKVKGYLPDSQVAFIDEIFKANSAILNTLLMILNEKLFDNGSHRYQIPLICLVGASNEMPESDELDALYDRFLFRKKVYPVSASGFPGLISSSGQEDRARIVESSNPDIGYANSRTVSVNVSITDKEIFSIRSEALDAVRVPKEVIQLISDTRSFLQTKMEPSIYVSDRRLVKLVNMLKVAAYTNGRLEISPFDCLLMQHCLWEKPEEQERIFEFILDQLSANEEVPNFEVVMQRIFARCCLVLTGANTDKTLRIDLNNFQREVKSRLEQISTTFSIATPVLTNNIWIAPEEASSLSAAVVPKTAQSKKQLEDLLLEIQVLKLIEETGKEPSICAELLGSRWADFLKSPLKLKEDN